MAQQPTNPDGLAVHDTAFARLSLAQQAVHLRSDHGWAWVPKGDDRAALLAAHKVAHQEPEPEPGAEQGPVILCHLPQVPPRDPAQANARNAVRLLAMAARTEPDFAGWLAEVLTAVAAEVGGPERLTAGRPGAWEAAHVSALAGGSW